MIHVFDATSKSTHTRKAIGGYVSSFWNCASCKMIIVFCMFNIKINSLCHLFDMTDACNSPSMYPHQTAKFLFANKKTHKVVFFLSAALAVCFTLYNMRFFHPKMDYLVCNLKSCILSQVIYLFVSKRIT